MPHKANSIRPFIGSSNFEISRGFYKDLGFEEVILSANMFLFKIGTLGFYLQNANIKDWINNTMIFLEVEDIDAYWNYLLSLHLTIKYKNVKIIEPKILDWGKECFLHDPSGILWHFGQFNNY
jgi:catechol 2,3-dioxygenase-like lactoylglutathione lyase family enzyme